MQYFLSIILWLLVSTATAYFANQRGRDPLVWFMIGMLLGFLGLLLLFLLPPVQEGEAGVQEIENSFLEPKTDSIPAASSYSHEYLIKEWFYYDSEKNRQGPVRFEDLHDLWKAGVINDSTFVWSDGMVNWQKIEEIQPLHTHLTET